jgi:type IV secretion system protein VirB9
MKLRILTFVLLAAVSAGFGQNSARVVKYHANDIVAVKAKLRYTTLIQLPSTEKILEVATGDKDFWIIDAVGSYCFLHPAKADTHSNLNLITDKGNVYSFTVDEVETGEPDLKVVIEPRTESAIAAAGSAAKFGPTSEVVAAQAELQAAQARSAQAIEQFHAEYPAKALKFDYRYRDSSKDLQTFRVSAIFHDDRFTYIKSSASEKFSIYELKDGKPDLVSFQLLDGTYAIPKIVDRGYLQIGKHRLDFQRAEQ